MKFLLVNDWQSNKDRPKKRITAIAPGFYGILEGSWKLLPSCPYLSWYLFLDIYFISEPNWGDFTTWMIPGDCFGLLATLRVAIDTAEMLSLNQRLWKKETHACRCVQWRIYGRWKILLDVMERSWAPRHQDRFKILLTGIQSASVWYCSLLDYYYIIINHYHIVKDYYDIIVNSDYFIIIIIKWV